MKEREAGLTSPKVLTFAILLMTLSARLYWASAAPMANDEAYYWDWSRQLQLSYFDHPPAVAWLAALGGKLAGGALGARLLLPLLHVAAVLWLLAAARLLKGAALDRRETLQLLILTEAVPAFSLEGVLLLPDAGLLAGLAASLYFVLKAWTTSPGQSSRWILPFGAALGVSGLCKYHAAPVAIGLGLGTLLYAWRQGRWREAVSFLLLAAVVAAVVTAPVWWWNAAHDWASFRFQGEHGFGGLSFEPLAALRAYLGQAVILTPLVLGGSVVLFSRGLAARRGLAVLPVLGALPLFVLLELTAWGKQELPHWLAPACWLLVPLLALHPWRRRSWQLNTAFAVLIAWVLPWVLVLPPLRQALVASFNGKPGPLSELTLWEPLASTLVADPRLASYLQPAVAVPGSAGCPTPVVLASVRWFWSAQLAFHLPGEPRVLSLDMNHPSYYSYRDDLPSYAGCQVLIIGDQRHLDTALLHRAVDEQQRLSVVVPSHQDTAVFAVLGRFRSLEDLRQLSAELGSGGARAPVR